MSNEFPDQIWKVRKRSGMGLLHSRDVADLANYNRAERGWAACPVILESYGIVKSGGSVMTFWCSHPNA